MATLAKDRIKIVSMSTSRAPTAGNVGPGRHNEAVRRDASVLHLDLDAFYASVEQRDKPSLRGKPVVVGGIGQRGVVATASYEARVFGVRSAMPAHEAHRRCPNAAFLAGRFDAYREASGQVMAILRALSPLVEPLSLDEAFVDLRTANRPVDLSRPGLQHLVDELRAEVSATTGGLTASVGVASSKFLAKVASELGKPDGSFLVDPGQEVDLLRSMKVGVIPGVGPVSQDKLQRIGVRTIGDLHTVSLEELVQTIGRAHAQALSELAYGRDDRPVVAERETKSISVEDTFETDLVDLRALSEILRRDARQVASRLAAAHLFARTVSIKVRRHDFSTYTRSRTLLSATDRSDVIDSVAQSLLSTADVTGGVRLLGVGVAGLTDVLQEDLFSAEVPAGGDDAVTEDGEVAADPATEADEPRRARRWLPGFDVTHDDHGRGWIWGAGLGRVTVRFETRDTPPGPVLTFSTEDPALHLA